MTRGSGRIFRPRSDVSCRVVQPENKTAGRRSDLPPFTSRHLRL